jgi:hypothetical protein
MALDKAEVEARHTRAIEALLTEPDMAHAAKAADIPYTSFRALFGDPEFVAKLREARCAVQDAALVHLRGLAYKAVKVVEDTMTGACVNGLRFRAATWVIEKGTEGMVADLTARIERLEEERGQ